MFISIQNYKKVALGVITSALLTGCGGGGSSSGNSGSLGFPSNAVSAQPTIANGKRVEDAVAKDQAIYSVNAVSSSSNQNLALTMKKVNETIQKVDKNYYSLNKTITETEYCSNRGSVNISGTETSAGVNVTLTYNNCDNDGTLFNGKVLGIMSDFDYTYDEFTKVDMRFLSDFTMQELGLSLKVISGSSVFTEYSNITDYNEADNMEMTINSISEVNGIKTGQQNSVYYFDLSSYNSFSMYQTSGKVYIDNLSSYVTYDTDYDMSQTPFVFNSSVLSSGEARYNMADGGKVKIIVESGESRVYVDANGDGIYELSE